MQHKALPFWSSCGINSTTHAVFESLDSRGKPNYLINMRSRVQARQIFVFSSAHMMGWLDDAESKVAGITSFMNSFARVKKSDSGYAHLLSPNASIIDAKQDAYDYAFYILSCAYRYKAFNDIHALTEANNLVDYVETHFKTSHGGWAEGTYLAPVRRQNPHMHFFEAFLTCYEFTQDAKWLARAGQIYSLFESFFYDPKTQVIREFFDHDWSLPKTELANIVEPGHMFEWVWLLRWYQELTNASVDEYCNSLYKKALLIGFDANSELIYDEVKVNGTPIKLTKRLWPHTEFIKASIAQAKSNKNASDFYEDQASKGISSLFEYYFDKQSTCLDANDKDDIQFNGRYVDQLDEYNHVCADQAPASTLYHIAMAAIVAENYNKRD
jgi:mannose/cellobiose epimerase-like protein (N-acyl-D-glucosamine 2-epimerase family)